ncbi:MAG TPA: lactate racemase domain-containing protein, partial [Anaerolineae bacterium]
MKLPPDWQLTIVESNPSTPLADLRAATEAALAQPLQSKRLSDLARPGARVCLVFTDATRACPDQVLVPTVLRELEAAGVRDDDIALLCAVGLHRASTRAEKIAKVGAAVVDRYRVIDHDARVVTDLPAGQGRLTINPLLLQSDLIIATGVVEPHQYAGYSGGGKTVVIGCGGEATIGATHAPKFLDQPGVRLGRVADNPFQQLVREATRQIGLKFVVNVVLDGDGRAVAVRAGDPFAAHDALI